MIPDFNKQAEELDVHYHDCDLNMGMIRHEAHGKLCPCLADLKCDCSVIRDVAFILSQAHESGLKEGKVLGAEKVCDVVQKSMKSERCQKFCCGWSAHKAAQSALTNLRSEQKNNQ